MLANRTLQAAANNSGYQIQQSLRFRSENGSFLSRTLVSPTDNKKWTWSGWVKRGKLSTSQVLFGAGANSNTVFAGIYFAADNIDFFNYNGAITWRRTTNALYRDPSAWMHIVCIFDSNNATANDQVQIWVNGSRITSFSQTVNPSGGASLLNDSAQPHTLGLVRTVAYNTYFDGYMADVYFVDGQALNAASFGKVDSITGVWSAKPYNGTYGNNGFYLDFKDSSSTTNLCLDRSGNANSWTPNNISVAGDGTYDSMVDVPLAGGGLEVGNYCTWNPLDKHAYINLSNNNLTITGNTATDSGATTGTIGVSSGKYYWEMTMGAVSGISYAGIGVTENAKNTTNAETYGVAPGVTIGALIRSGGGAHTNGYGGFGSYSGATTPSFTTGDVIGVALDADNGAVYFHKNGVWMNTSVPTSGATKTGCFIYWTPGSFSVRPAGGGYNGDVNTTNFGRTAFAYTPPTGFGILRSAPTGRGNYCTLNPLQIHLYVTMGEGNLKLTGNSGSGSGISMGTQSFSSGLFYWEMTQGTVASSEYFGVMTYPIIGQNLQGTALETNYGVGIRYNGDAYGISGELQSVSAFSWTTGDVIGIAVDATNGAVYYSKNGTWLNSGVPTSGAAKTGAFFKYTPSSSRIITPFLEAFNTGNASINFGQHPLTYTPPVGFKALHTGNFLTPAIKKPNQYFEITLFTGTGSTQSVQNSSGMQPDFIWFKSRNNARSNALFDSVRGRAAGLLTDGTSTETTSSVGNDLVSFNVNGFTVGAPQNYGSTNTSADTIVAWQWKAGGTAVTNTTGSITSQVSVNTASGFSIVSCTTNSSVSTIGHGLGAIPRMIIGINRTVSNGRYVYHSGLTSASYYLTLNSTNAQISNTAVWGGIAPTTSVFTQGSGAWNNGDTAIFYCFAEVAGYSKFGSYTGTGSSDGPFIYCGFRAKYILIRRIDTADGWIIYDTQRSDVNQVILGLQPNSSIAEYTETNNPIDVLSSGFKLRGTGTSSNLNTATYIFAAFAEVPFKYALAR